jgi:hypothetical protein
MRAATAAGVRERLTEGHRHGGPFPWASTADLVGWRSKKTEGDVGAVETATTT